MSIFNVSRLHAIGDLASSLNRVIGAVEASEQQNAAAAPPGGPAPTPRLEIPDEYLDKIFAIISDVTDSSDLVGSFNTVNRDNYYITGMILRKLSNRLSEDQRPTVERIMRCIDKINSTHLKFQTKPSDLDFLRSVVTINQKYTESALKRAVINEEKRRPDLGVGRARISAADDLEQVYKQLQGTIKVLYSLGVEPRISLREADEIDDRAHSECKKGVIGRPLVIEMLQALSRVTEQLQPFMPPEQWKPSLESAAAAAAPAAAAAAPAAAAAAAPAAAAAAPAAAAAAAAAPARAAAAPAAAAAAAPARAAAAPAAAAAAARAQPTTATAPVHSEAVNTLIKKLGATARQIVDYGGTPKYTSDEIKQLVESAQAFFKHGNEEGAIQLLSATYKDLDTQLKMVMPKSETTLFGSVRGLFSDLFGGGKKE